MTDDELQYAVWQYDTLHRREVVIARTSHLAVAKAAYAAAQQHSPQLFCQLRHSARVIATYDPPTDIKPASAGHVAGIK